MIYSVHDDRVESLDTRKDYFKMAHRGTELCRNKNTNEGKRTRT